MCEKHICDNRDESEQILPLCPIVIKHYGHPCDDAVTDLSQESVAQVEEIVMSWAAEHPEPVYPRWIDWLADVGLIINTADHYAFNFTAAVDQIPADIAQKLGIEPKEGRSK